MKTIQYIKKYKLDIGINFDYSEFVTDLKREFYALLEVSRNELNPDNFFSIMDAMEHKWERLNMKTKGVLPSYLWDVLYYKIMMKRFYKTFPKLAEYKAKCKTMKISRLVQELKNFASERSDYKLSFFLNYTSHDFSFKVINYSPSSIGELEYESSNDFMKLERILEGGGYFNDYRIHILFEELSSQLQKVARSKFLTQKDNPKREVPFINFNTLLKFHEYKMHFDYLNLDIASATEDKIKDVYKELCKTSHPDKGGDHDTFVEIIKAKMHVLNT